MMGIDYAQWEFHFGNTLYTMGISIIPMMGIDYTQREFLCTHDGTMDSHNGIIKSFIDHGNQFVRI